MKILSAKHEDFVQRYVATGALGQSYIDAGYSSGGAAASASKLLRLDKIKQRIKEVQAKLEIHTGITLDVMVQEFKKDREAAREDSNHHASIKANVEIARLHGLYEVDNAQKVNPYAGKTREELIIIAKEKIKSLEKEMN
jgi:phage terminase small subunit